MKQGTRSLLFGGHQFVIHPIAVAVAWWRLYGCPRDPRLWVAFAVHDIGYWGLDAMDDTRGQLHPERGGRIMGALFGPTWRAFCVGHSRYYAQRVGVPVSRLMRADKYATVITPYWLYVGLCWLSGEYREYVAFHAAAGHTFAHGLHGWARSLREDWRRYGPEVNR